MLGFLTFRDYLALNVYVALCYYKLDYYDVSQVSPATATIAQRALASLLIVRDIFLSPNICSKQTEYQDFQLIFQEVLAVYLNQYSDSAIAINLRACNHFRLYNGKAAEVSAFLLLNLETCGIDAKVCFVQPALDVW